MQESQTDYSHTNCQTQNQYTPGGRKGQARPAILRKRLGSTTYEVNVHFSQTNRETMRDKILRLAKREVNK